MKQNKRGPLASSSTRPRPSARVTGEDSLSLGGRGDVDAERRRDDVGGGGVEGGGAEDDRSMRRDKAGKMSGQRKLVVNCCFF